MIVFGVETNGTNKKRGATPTDHKLHICVVSVQFRRGLLYDASECKQMKA